MSYQVIKQFLKSALMHVSRQKKIMTLAFPTVVKNLSLPRPSAGVVTNLPFFFRVQKIG